MFTRWVCAPGCDYPIGTPWHKSECDIQPSKHTSTTETCPTCGTIRIRFDPVLIFEGQDKSLSELITEVIQREMVNRNGTWYTNQTPKQLTKMILDVVFDE